MAERGAAKRAPAQAMAATYLANLNVDVSQLGDWTTQTEDSMSMMDALGDDAVMREAVLLDREAMYSMGFRLVCEADRTAGATQVGASGRSETAGVGFDSMFDSLPVAQQTVTRRRGQLMTECCICGCQPCAEEGVALLEKAAGQGHAYAMNTLGSIHDMRNEYEQAVQWYTKSAEAGLPTAMFTLGCCFDKGEGAVTPDYPAAADWYTRAAEAGHGRAAYNLGTMYAVGRGRAWRIMPACYKTFIPWVEWRHLTWRA